MTQDQLEMAWFGSIFCRPEFCRPMGLCGLDQSMFSSDDLFSFGSALLRAADFEGYVVPDEELKRQMMQQKLFSKVTAAEDSLMFSASFYKYYCEEIEKRAHKKHRDPEWMS